MLSFEISALINNIIAPLEEFTPYRVREFTDLLLALENTSEKPAPVNVAAWWITVVVYLSHMLGPSKGSGHRGFYTNNREVEMKFCQVKGTSGLLVSAEDCQSYSSTTPAFARLGTKERGEP